MINAITTIIENRKTMNPTKPHCKIWMFGFCLAFISAFTLAETAMLNYAGLDADVLYIDQQIKDELDRDIRPIKKQSARIQALHELMFSDDKWAISYSSSRTYTAQQTYTLRKGNCISLAALFIASARYVGLKAKFQTVSVPEIWERKNDYYVVPGHINAVVFIPKQKIHIEFLRTFFDTDMAEGRPKVIADEKAFSEYHNNVGMELLENTALPLAQKHIEKSLALHAKYDYTWSNYGVILKFQNDLEGAEKMYRRALKMNKRNYSALTNLYILLSETKQLEEADKIAQQVERYAHKNPYYLAKIAETALNTGRANLALKTIKRAIRKNPNIARFYRIAARVYTQLDDEEKANSSLNRARELAESV